jgi:cell division protein FtsW
MIDLLHRALALPVRSHRARADERFLDRPYASLQLLLLASSGLLCFGVLMAVSTTIAASDGTSGAATGSIWTQTVKEGLFLVIGLPLFWLAMRMPPRAFRLLAYPTLAVGVAALLAVLVPSIGISAYGARRWIDLGPLQVQPSEIAKIGLLLWGADLLARKQQLGTLRRSRHLFLPLVPGFLLVALLVMLEPDLGTTCCLVLILLGLLWMIGMPVRYFLGVVAVVVAAVVGLALAAPYRWQRVISFLHPFQDAKGSGYHEVESLYALGSGGLFGVGLGQGTSKYWVPNANSDYVFAIIGEELGLLGCLAVLALFTVFAYTGMRIARRSADPFVRLVAGAATIWLTGQAVINVGYVTGLLPVTGIPLPFISAGGTSLLAAFFVLGMLVSFARHETPAVVAARKAERLGRRSRWQRWLLVPVPKPYTPPRRRPVRAAPPRRSGDGLAAARRAAPAAAVGPRIARQSAPRPSAVSRSGLRATGTDGTRRAR